MSGRTIVERVEQLGRALDRLREALAEPSPTELMIDGIIQRFEFVFELYWKTFKAIVEHEGFRANSPRDSIRKAFAAGLIEDEAAWIELLEARNLTAHIYDEATARRIHDRVRERMTALDATYLGIVDRFGIEGRS